MIAISVSSLAVRRALRTFVVAATVAVALVMSLANIFSQQKSLSPGVSQFWTVANVVVMARPSAQKAGISVGDRIDYRLMPPSDRYGDVGDGLRVPPVGKPISFIVDRNGRRHVAVVTAPYQDPAAQGFNVPGSAVQKVINVVTILLGAALFLIRPTLLTAAFFLYVLDGSVHIPIMYYFLPVSGYAVIMVLFDAFVGVGAIGFLLLGLSLDPTRRLPLRTVVVAAVALFALIVAPLATSDVFELLHGTRTAWPIAGWASFAALCFCYVVGFVLLLRAAIKASTPRSLRFAAALLAASGALTILDWTTNSQIDNWYNVNLPTALMNREGWSLIHMLWWEVGLQLALFLPAALAVSYAFIRAASFGARLTFFRIVCYAGLTLVTVAIFLSQFFDQRAYLPGFFAHFSSGFFAQMNSNLDNLEYFFLTPLCCLVAFYLIVRTRVADTGPVFSRVVAYVIVALIVIAAVVVANIEWGSELPNSALALLIPVEILVAIVIGYWVSGLRDLAGCLSLAYVDAWNAWAEGHPRDERDALTRSVGLAERTRRRGVIAEVRAQAAFSAWRDGDDGEFERNADKLQHLLGERNLQGLRGFAQAATPGDDELSFEEEDLPEWRARGALLLCARTNDASRAQQLASDALASANRAGSAPLQVLASVAIAETKSDQRNSALERAHAIARDAGWPALSKSILALRADSRDIGILQPFVEIRLRKSRPARPIFEVSFFNAELSAHGAAVALTEKPLELLLTVASARTGTNDNDLIDALWPESDGDAARNSFRACLRRLRESAGDARIVARVGKRYVVHPWADVDLWRFASLISACRENGGRESEQELREMCDALRAGEGRRATLGEWFYRFEQTLNRKLEEAERLLGREPARGAKT